MKKTLIVFGLVGLFSGQARADIPYFFLKVSCVKDLHFLEMQSFMLWNVCGGDSQFGGDCSKVTSLRDEGIYELDAIHKGSSNLPPSCELGFGKIISVTLDRYSVSQYNSNVYASYKVTVNQQEIARIDAHEDVDLRVTAWRHPHFIKETQQDVMDQATHTPVLFPRIDINICRVEGRNSISIPDSMLCSFKEIADDSAAFPVRNGVYELKKTPAGNAATPN